MAMHKIRKYATYHGAAKRDASKEIRFGATDDSGIDVLACLNGSTQATPEEVAIWPMN